jgi:carbamoyl-phosphate synthase large subunit
MSDVTVLISGAGTATCQSVIKGLRSQDEYSVRIVTVDMNPENAGRYFSDAFYSVPAAGDESFLPRLLEICRQERVDLLIPIVDYEFNKLAAARRAFAEVGCRVVISEPRVIQICNDKWASFKFFRQHGLATPMTWLPEQIDAAKLSYPIFIKPRLMGRGSIDAYRVNSATELATRLAAIDQPLLQEFIRGKEFTVDILCDFAGKALNGVVRERIETKCGVSYKGRSIRDRGILDAAVQVAEALPIIGPVNIQCFRNTDGVVVFEINPRYSGALVLSIAAGFNSPLWLLRLAKGRRVKAELGSYEEGVLMMRYWQETFVDRCGNPLPALTISPAEPIENEVAGAGTI